MIEGKINEDSVLLSLKGKEGLNNGHESLEEGIHLHLTPVPV